MTVLPDTSVWVSYLRQGRRGQAADLDHLLDTGEVVVCGPVVAELLAGADEPTRGELWGLLVSLPWADLGPTEWRRVGETAAALRAAGLSLPLTDIEIAVAASAATAAVWSDDSDSDRIQTALPELLRYGT